MQKPTRTHSVVRISDGSAQSGDDSHATGPSPTRFESRLMTP